MRLVVCVGLGVGLGLGLGLGLWVGPGVRAGLGLQVGLRVGLLQLKKTPPFGVCGWGCARQRAVVAWVVARDPLLVEVGMEVEETAGAPREVEETPGAARDVE